MLAKFILFLRSKRHHLHQEEMSETYSKQNTFYLSNLIVVSIVVLK